MYFVNRKQRELLNNKAKLLRLFLAKNLSLEEKQALTLAKQHLQKIHLRINNKLNHLSRRLGLGKVQFLDLKLPRTLKEIMTIFKAFKIALSNMHLPFMPPLILKLSPREREIWLMIYRKKIFLRDMEFLRHHRMQMELNKKKLNNFLEIAKAKQNPRLKLSIDIYGKSENVDEKINKLRQKFQDFKEYANTYRQKYSKNSQETKQKNKKYHEQNELLLDDLVSQIKNKVETS